MSTVESCQPLYPRQQSFRRLDVKLLKHLRRHREVSPREQIEGALDSTAHPCYRLSTTHLHNRIDTHRRPRRRPRPTAPFPPYVGPYRTRTGSVWTASAPNHRRSQLRTVRNGATWCTFRRIPLLRARRPPIRRLHQARPTVLPATKRIGMHQRATHVAKITPPVNSR